MDFHTQPPAPWLFRAGYSVAYVPIHAAKRIGKSHIQPLKDGVRFF